MDSSRHWLGSRAWHVDCRNQVGPTGHVVGVDMTGEMLHKAHSNAGLLGFRHVEFRKGLAKEFDAKGLTFIAANPL